jgi:biotin synthase
MELCCGGIVGMGESWQDRLDMAFTVRELEAESVPVNFLNPIPGTKLGNRKTMRPLDALRTIAIFRFINPRAEIRVAGGREKTLRDLQSWVFQAGANSIMVGNYLTTMGRDPKHDIQMLEDLELNGEGIKHRIERVRELAEGIAAQVPG